MAMFVEALAHDINAQPAGVGVVLSGGEITDQAPAAAHLLRLIDADRLRAMYSGLTHDELLADPRPEVADLLDLVDLASLGRFDQSNAEAGPMRGSTNQIVLATSGRLAAPTSHLGVELRITGDAIEADRRAAAALPGEVARPPQPRRPRAPDRPPHRHPTTPARGRPRSRPGGTVSRIRRQRAISPKHRETVSREADRRLQLSLEGWCTTHDLVTEHAQPASVVSSIGDTEVAKVAGDGVPRRARRPRRGTRGREDGRRLRRVDGDGRVERPARRASRGGAPPGSTGCRRHPCAPGPRRRGHRGGGRYRSGGRGHDRHRHARRDDGRERHHGAVPQPGRRRRRRRHQRRDRRRLARRRGARTPPGRRESLPALRSPRRPLRRAPHGTRRRGWPRPPRRDDDEPSRRGGRVSKRRPGQHEQRHTKSHGSTT